jgi:hypothetical protein
MTATCNHELCDGRSGAGKTQYQRRQLYSLLRMRPGPAVFVFDSKGSLTTQATLDLYRDGQMRNVLVEDFDLRRSLGHTFQQLSRDPDECVRRIETKQSIEQTKAKLMFSRGVLDDSKNPNIRDALDTALGCYAMLDAPVPWYWLRDVLMPNSDAQVYFLEHCTDPEYRKRLQFFARLPLSQWEYRCGAADRILRDICGDPIVQQRVGNTFDVRSFINAGGRFFGIGNGNVSRFSQAFIFNSILLDVVDAAKKGIERPVVVLIEEGQSGGQLTPLLGRSMLEIREAGVEIRICTQNILALPNKELLEEIIGNISRFVIFSQVSPSAVKHKAEILATPGLNAHLIHSTEYMTKSVDDGWDEIATKSNSTSVDDDGRTRKGVTEGVTYRKRTHEIEEAHHRYVGYNDQKVDFERKVTCLACGECWIREGTNVFFHRVPMLEKPWDGLIYSRRPLITLAQKKLELALETIKSGLLYRSVEITLPPKPFDIKTGDESVTGRFSKGSIIPTRFRKSSTSSRNARKRKDTRRPTDEPNDS